MTPEHLQFSRAIRPHLEKLDRFVASRVENQYVADICSDVIALAWQKRNSFESSWAAPSADLESPDQDHLLGFLIITAKFQIKNLERKVGNARRLQPLSIKIGDVPSPEDDAIAAIAVSKAFKSLKARDQELLAMLAWDGLSVSQISRILGITENNVGVRINRARTKFRQALKRESDTSIHERKNS